MEPATYQARLFLVREIFSERPFEGSVVDHVRALTKRNKSQQSVKA